MSADTVALALIGAVFAAFGALLGLTCHAVLRKGPDR